MLVNLLLCLVGVGAVVLRVRQPGTALSQLTLLLGGSLKLVALHTSWREVRVHILINPHVLLHISEVLLHNDVPIFHDDAT
jgi:hypothetical protein